MPSLRFEKIDKEKRDRIIYVALKEFANNEYEKVSINKIIKKADISRGSFYTYFIDKEDLFLYIVKDYVELMYTFVKERFYFNKKDIFETIIDIVNMGIEVKNNSIEEKIIFSISTMEGILKKVGEMEIEHKIEENFDKSFILTNILYEESKVEYKKNFQDFYYMLDILFRQALRLIHECLVYKNWNTEKNEVENFIDLKKKIFKRQIEIIKKGYLSI